MKKTDTVNQLASGDTVLCPVRAWAAIVKKVRGYPGSSDETPISAVWNNGCVEHITPKMLVNALEAAVEAVGQEAINIQAGEIGTHSIWSGVAIALYLAPSYNTSESRWNNSAIMCQRK